MNLGWRAKWSTPWIKTTVQIEEATRRSKMGFKVWLWLLLSLWHGLAIAEHIWNQHTYLREKVTIFGVSFTWIGSLHSQLDSRLSYVKQILDNELSTVWQVRRMSYTLSVSLEGSSSYGGFQLVTLHLLLEICSTISTFEWRRALCSQASDLNTTANLSWPRVCLSILASYAGSRTAL